MPYRIEVSANARAGCKNSECSAAKVKIQKGELRYATQVTIQDHTSWAYKHWGCVTPVQIQNLIEESGGDTDMVDGYDQLPADAQEKVQFALANGHVSDEDWKGDVEVNRPGQKGFRVKGKAAKKKAAKQADEDDEHVEAPKPKPKRGRATKEEQDEDEAPAPKKVRGKGKKSAVQDEETPESDVEVPAAKVKKAARGKKTAAKVEVNEEDDAEEPEQPKPKRGKKAAPKQEAQDDDAEKPEPPKSKHGKKAAPKKDVDEDDAAEEPEPPKPKRGKKAAAAAGGEKAAPQKRSGRVKKAVNYEEE